jgi:two-component system NtrC family sensor kinase
MSAATQRINAGTLPPSLRGAACVFEALPLGVIIYDDTLRTLYQNENAQCIFPRAADLAATLARELIESRFEDWQANLRGAWTRPTAQRFDGLTLRADSAAPRHVNVIVTTLADAGDHSIRRGLLLVEDVTARFTMEQRLAASERLAAVGKLCAAVAHELNNPLDGILRFLNLALRVSDDATNRKLHKYIAAARDGCQRLVHVVRALLDFSRNSPPPVAEQTLARLIDEAVRTFEGRAAERGVSIFCRYPPGDLPAVGGVNLFQVFCNLIKNAIDAMPAGGALTIAVEDRPNEIVISFTDSGVGLPANAERMFEPFFTTKPPGQGTGLGLAVCKEIVERLGGSIAAANRTDARGAVLAVRLPRGMSALYRTPPGERTNTGVA